MARSILWICAAEVFLQIGHAVAVGIAKRAIVAGGISGIEAVGDFPIVGQAVAIVVGRTPCRISRARARSGRLPVGGIVAVGTAYDALQ